MKTQEFTWQQRLEAIRVRIAAADAAHDTAEAIRLRGDLVEQALQHAETATAEATAVLEHSQHVLERVTAQTTAAVDALIAIRKR